MLNLKRMKQRSTTPVSASSLAAKSPLVASAIVMSMAAPMTFMTSVANADRYDDQIRALRNEISGYQSHADNLGAQARSLEDELRTLDGQKATIQAQIKISETQYAQLQEQIKRLKKKIAENKEVLGDTLASLYADDRISPLEMLASSNNIGDYVDKQEYRSSLRDTLSKTIDQINRDKVALEKKKAETERVLEDQKSQRAQLVAKEQERQKLLADTRGQEEGYRSLMSQRDAQIQSLQQQQAAELAARARQASSRGGGYTASSDGSNGGYPSVWANAPMNAFVDSWGMYTRQCVSYAAFKVQQAYGNMPYWGGVGNANQWPGNARAAGIPTGTTPKAGSVGVVSSGYYGHVAWVEAVYPNGKIRISHYNVNWNGSYAIWDNLDPSFFDTYIYFGG